MKTLELIGALEGLSLLEPEHAPKYKAAMSAGRQRGWGYALPYLLTRKRAGRSEVLWCEDEGTLCLFLWRRKNGVERLELPVAPAPMNPDVLRRCLQRCNRFNGDRSARVLRVDERDGPSVASLVSLRVEARRSQYLYKPADMLGPDGNLDLQGRRYRTVRRNVALVEAMPGVEMHAYSAQHESGCRTLLKNWGAAHRALHGTAGGVGGARRILDLTSTLTESDLRGEVIYIDGRLCAFAFGCEIRPGMGCFLEAKSDAEIRGLSYFQRAHFLARFAGVEWVNDGSDVGRAGLRQIKQSLRPAAMHTEFRAFQEASLD